MCTFGLDEQLIFFFWGNCSSASYESGEGFQVVLIPHRLY